MMGNIKHAQPSQGSHKSFNVRSLLKRFQIRPDKGLGQNFLVDQRSLVKVVNAANLQGDELVLEVGAGLGSLTRLLSDRSKEVLAIEFDRNLMPALRFALQDISNVRIIEADILKLDLAELVKDSDFIVVANIPYYLTSALIRKLLEGTKPADRIVLTVQREVAVRVLASDGKSSLLSLSVQMYGDATIAGYIPARAFYPSPKVESAILSIQVHPEPKVPAEIIDSIFKIAKAGFSQKRKQLRNSMSAGLGLEAKQVEEILRRIGIDPRLRAQELLLADWATIARELSNDSE